MIRSWSEQERGLGRAIDRKREMIGKDLLLEKERRAVGEGLERIWVRVGLSRRGIWRGRTAIARKGEKFLIRVSQGVGQN